MVQLHSFVCGCPVFPIPFIEETVCKLIYCMYVLILDISYKWNLYVASVSTFFHWKYFLLEKNFQTYPCCNMYRYLISFCGWIILHCIKSFELLPFLGYLFFFFIFIFFKLFIYLFIAVLGFFRFYARAFSSCGKWGPLFIAVRGLLTIVASLVAEHRLQTRRLSNCGSRA